MTTFRRWCGLWLGLLALAPALAGTPAPLPADAQVDGLRYAQLTAAWWQWALTAPVPPYLDPDGRFCGEGQRGSVWFLAGTAGGAPVNRRCEVPEGKYLLLPIINMYHASRYVENGQVLPMKACTDVRERAALNNDHLQSAEVLVDGARLPGVRQYRVASGCFDLHPETASQPGQVRTLAASDGYWLLLPPLPKGRHTISVGANYGKPGAAYGRMVQSFAYELWIGGKPRWAFAPAAIGFAPDRTGRLGRPGASSATPGGERAMSVEP